MRSLIFYTNPMSRGQIARWMLEEIGAPYETRMLEYGTGMKAPEYLAINPMGKVPAIQHGETIVTEVAAILTYLADAFPDAGLAPAREDRGSYYRWLFYTSGPFEAATTAKTLGFEPTPEQSGFAGFGSHGVVMDVIEKLVSENEYIAADHFTAADLYLAAQLDFGLSFKTLEPRPAFVSYRDRLIDRDACRRAKETDNALIAQMTTS